MDIQTIIELNTQIQLENIQNDIERENLEKQQKELELQEIKQQYESKKIIIREV